MKRIKNANDLQAEKNVIELRKLQLEKEMRQHIHEIKKVLRKPPVPVSPVTAIAQQLVSSASVQGVAVNIGKKILRWFFK